MCFYQGCDNILEIYTVYLTINFVLSIIFLENYTALYFITFLIIFNIYSCILYSIFKYECINIYSNIWNDNYYILAGRYFIVQLRWFYYQSLVHLSSLLGYAMFFLRLYFETSKTIILSYPHISDHSRDPHPQQRL